MTNTRIIKEEEFKSLFTDSELKFIKDSINLQLMKIYGMEEDEGTPEIQLTDELNSLVESLWNFN